MEHYYVAQQCRTDEVRSLKQVLTEAWPGRNILLRKKARNLQWDIISPSKLHVVILQNFMWPLL